MIRVDRAKKLKTGVSFYRNSFRMHPPYMILCDGNFLFAAVDLKIANLEEQFQDAFKGKVYLKAPDCVTAELAKMKGRGFRDTEKFAKEKCQRFRCSHEPGSPAKCIIDALRAGFVGGVATQDHNLRRTIHRDFPKIPVFFITDVLQIVRPPKGLRERVEAELAEKYVPKADDKDCV